MRRGMKFHSSADPPPEVVSEALYWQTEPVWMEKLAERRRVDLIAPDSVITTQILHSSK